MEYPSINIQGNILSSEILDLIRNEDIKYQFPADFKLDKKTTVRDEVGLAWAAARAHWTAFSLRVNRFKVGDSGASETRNSWMIPLLRELGYDVEKASMFLHPDTQKTYAISHKAANLGDFPIHIMGINDDLDKRRENSGPRMSPHALTQEYLNNTEHTYALVSNGRYLRLLRDATRLVRLSYLEFDLEKMMEQELYADFAILFRLLHATRMPQQADQSADSIIEYYHLEALASGSRIRENLSRAVEKSIKALANGFLKHQHNKAYIDQDTDNNGSPRVKLNGVSLDPADYYLYQLRLIYRLLFLIVTEERNLVYPDSKEESIQRKRKIYYDFYSIEKLRKLASKSVFVDGRKHDLWEGLITTFLLFEKSHYGQRLRIKPLGSGLFSSSALGQLPNLKLDNSTLLEVVRLLTLFENEQGNWIRVNYSDLDVEEFGSVYEGLLEYDAAFINVNGLPAFTFREGTGRSSSGSHYTPEELVKPLIKHSLEYVIEDKLKHPNKEAALLSIKVCDVACGSGHILLSAARRIATELARVRTNEDQPTPSAMRLAIRDVIKNCIYGVDKNPLAVELCKVALWLEAHNPGEPLNFLDHHIKSGDAIVGLAHKEELQRGIVDEAFKVLPGDDKEFVKAISKRNKNEREMRGQILLDFERNVDKGLDDVLEIFKQFSKLPETTPEEIEKKSIAYNKLFHGGALQRLKTIADLQVAQFFIPKIFKNKEYLVTDANYFQYLKGTKSIPSNIEAKIIALTAEKRFFHWFLEFPDIFQKGGFDCILGNPPYLGGSKISTNYGSELPNYLVTAYPESRGIADLVSYFFKRDYQLLKVSGFFSLITTDSISQGVTRESTLDYLLKQGSFNYAIKSMRWPGDAAVNIAFVSFYKGNWTKKRYIKDRQVNFINSLLDEDEINNKNFTLFKNKDKAYTGSKVYGEGFVLNPIEVNKILAINPNNSKVIKPYISGDDIVNNYKITSERFVINFSDWPLSGKSFDCAEYYPECLSIIEERVKPERAKLKDGNPAKEKWWQYERIRKELYDSIADKSRTIVFAQTAKYIAPSFIGTENIFSVKVIVVNSSSFYDWAICQSSFHNEWAWKFGTTMGSSTLQYSTSGCFENFPWPHLISDMSLGLIEQLGEQYHDYRQQLMLQMQLGLTKIYNLFHCSTLRIVSTEEGSLQDNAFEKAIGKEAAQLRKHLAKTPGSISFNEAVTGIETLRSLHVQMDQAVLEAYGWQDLQLRHDFNDVDYLPENDRIRYTIHPEARKEVLKRLLELNHQIHEEEVKVGLWDKKSNVKKEKNSKSLSKKLDIPNNQLPLLPNLDLNMKEWSLHDGIYSIQDCASLSSLSTDKIRRWFTELSKEQYIGFAGQSRNDVSKLRISFHGLIELFVIGTLRDANINLKNILTAREKLKAYTNKEYPFATNNVNENLKVAGKTITFNLPLGNVDLDGSEQFNLSIIKDFFREIVFEGDIAQRIIPVKGRGKIVIDPKEANGKPSIINKEIPVDTIIQFYTGPNSLQSIQKQFNLEEEEILAALEYSNN
jgi:uncharacterized protein (DUF433 family)